MRMSFQFLSFLIFKYDCDNAELTHWSVQLLSRSVVVGGLVRVSSFLARLGHFAVVVAVVVSRFPGGAVLQIKRKIYNLIRIKKT